MKVKWLPFPSKLFLAGVWFLREREIQFPGKTGIKLRFFLVISGNFREIVFLIKSRKYEKTRRSEI
jgi:hypothetical protein